MILFLMAGLQQGLAQEMLLNKAVDSLQAVINQNLPDSISQKLVSDSTIVNDELMNDVNKEVSLLVDSTLKAQAKPAKEWSTWRPDPKRALWLALVIPGGGQIYNRKYWKLPIVYGGFVGCLYAMNWNNTMYKDYSQAYLDLTDNDPNTQSYNQFLHLGAKINDSNKKHYVDVFKKRKDRFRRWRDLSFFVLVGVYALSVIDAYVDAELSVFDISKDLSLKVEPTVINNHSSTNVLDASSVGLQCSLNF
jgi:hypothetical protein